MTDAVRIVGWLVLSALAVMTGTLLGVVVVSLWSRKRGE